MFYIHYQELKASLEIKYYNYNNKIKFIMIFNKKMYK